MMKLECKYIKLYAGSKTIHFGILINVFYNSENGRHEAAILEVDKGSPSGYNEIPQIVDLDSLSVTPKKD
jgi:hypothetical protein